jgi:hypothetical protein
MKSLRAGAVAFVLLSLAAAPLASRAAPITDNLIAWWEFSGAGTADSSGNGRNLTFRANPNAAAGTAAAPTVVSGGVGGGTALNMPGATGDPRNSLFDGAVSKGDAYLADVPGGNDATDLSSAGGMAVQAWVFFEALPANRYQVIVGKATSTGFSARGGWIMDFLIRADGSQSLGFYAHTGIGQIRLELPVSLATGGWHQVVVTQRPEQAFALEMYLDSTSLGTTSAGQFSGGPGIDGFDLRIGTEFINHSGVQDIWIHPFLGDLDKVALWNRSLSTDEIASLYNRGAGITIGAAAVPAPSSLLLLALGLAALGAGRKK